MGGESCALLVNNVPANMKDDCIAALFNIYGDIVGIHLDECNDAKTKIKYCLIIFSKKNEALRALKELDKIPPLKFDISTYPPTESREDLEPTSVWKKVEVFSVPAAITSKSLPQPLLSPGVTYTVLAVTRVDSPSSLVVRLDVSSGCYQRIVNELNNSEPAKISPDWQLCPGDMIAARDKGTWMRGIVLERLDTGYLSVYLPDSGHQITSPEKEIGLVASDIAKFPACAIQVSLAGVIPADNAANWNQAAINISKDFLRNGAQFLRVRIIGFLESGRLAVDIVKEKEGDLKSKLLLGKLGMPAQETNQQKPLQHIKYEAYNSHEPAPTPIINKKERSNVSSEEDCHVLEVVSLDKIFIMRASKVPLFEDVTAKLVDVKDELKLPRVGFRCVAKDSDLAYRVEVLSSVEKFKFKVNFIDQGYEKVVDKKQLYVLKGPLKDLEPMAEAVSLETAENVDRNDAKIVDEVRKYLVDDNKKFVCSVLRNGRVIFKDDSHDNVVEMIIKGTQGGLSKPTPITKKPEQQSVTNKPVVDAKPAREVVNTAKPAVTSSVQNRLSSSHRIQRVNEDKMPAQITTPKVNGNAVLNKPTGSTDANETVEESGVNQFKAKNVRFQQTPKNLNQVTSALTADANAKVVNVVQDVKKVTADAKAAGQPQVPEPFAGQVVYAESINCFFVHRLSNSDLYDEIQEDISRSSEALNIMALGKVCAVNHSDSEGNPAFFRGRVEKMKKDGSLVKVFLMDEGLTISCAPTKLYKLEHGKRFDYEQLPGLLMKCSLGTPDSKWPEAVDKMFVELINENKSELTVKPLTVLDGVIHVDLEDSEGSYVELMRMCESETRSNSPVTSPAETAEVYTTDKFEEEKAKNVPVVIEEIVKQQPIVQKEPIAMPKVLPSPFKCVVTWINSMEDLYVTSIEANNMDYFELLEALITEVNEGRSTQLKSAKVGQMCLIEVDEIFQRAVVKSVDGNNVEVLAIDEGRQVCLPVTSLLSLAKFEDMPGQAIHVGLADVPEEAKAQLDIFKQIISIDERVTFLARPDKFVGDKLMIKLFEISEDGELNILDYFE